MGILLNYHVSTEDYPSVMGISEMTHAWMAVAVSSELGAQGLSVHTVLSVLISTLASE